MINCHTFTPSIPLKPVKHHLGSTVPKSNWMKNQFPTPSIAKVAVQVCSLYGRGVQRSELRLNKQILKSETDMNLNYPYVTVAEKLG
eukprot:2854007-Amphidinium_carterae.1